MVEWNTLVSPAVNPMNVQKKESGGIFTVMCQRPMRADQTELEADRPRLMNGDPICRWLESALPDVISLGVRVYHWICGRKQVFFPTDSRSPIIPVELVFVGREMSQAKLVVSIREHRGVEFFDVWLASALDMSSAPARVDQLPLTIVDSYHIPGMTGFKGWECRPWSQILEPEALTVAGNH